jgi:stage V sporulation protein AD
MKLEIPFLGQYGACSTMAQTLIMAATAIESGIAKNAVAVTSSHYCSAERQYRFPLQYGGQRTPTSQWTVTGSGAAVVCNENQKDYPKIKKATVGRILEMGIKDVNNMGAAMAPAAYETLKSYFEDTKTAPKDYDLILTGDLGEVGVEVLKNLMSKDGIDLSKNYKDCGLMIYHKEGQDVHAGGSGCGCSASVLCSLILNDIKKGELKNILFMATGAMMSPTSSQQGEAIPGIAHLLNIGI